MTDIRTIIAELRELEKKATGGHWGWEQHGHDKSQMALYSGRDNQHHGLRLFNANDGDTKYSDNLAFITASRNALPMLLDYIAKLEVAAKSLDEVTEVLAANDKGPGSGWFAPCLNRARAALKAVGY